MGRKSRAKRERKVREPAFKRARNHRMRDRFCRMSSAECGVHQRPRARQIAAVALRQERSIQNRELLLRAAYLGVAACHIREQRHEDVSARLLSRLHLGDRGFKSCRTPPNRTSPNRRKRSSARPIQSSRDLGRLLHPQEVH